eukprot:scaffold52860_cov17-Tisochrysis_lutea.AAC.1
MSSLTACAICTLQIGQAADSHAVLGYGMQEDGVQRHDTRRQCYMPEDTARAKTNHIGTGVASSNHAKR